MTAKEMLEWRLRDMDQEEVIYRATEDALDDARLNNEAMYFKSSKNAWAAAALTHCNRVNKKTCSPSDDYLAAYEYVTDTLRETTV